MKSRLIIYIFAISFIFSSNISFANCDELPATEFTQQYGVMYASWYDWGNRSFQAYIEEKPDIAIWALKNYTEFLEEYYRSNCFLGEIRIFLRNDLILNHGRLALIYQKISNQKMFEHHIAESINYHRVRIEGTTKTLHTKDTLISLIKDVDAEELKEINNK